MGMGITRQKLPETTMDVPDVCTFVDFTRQMLISRNISRYKSTIFLSPFYS